MVRWTAFFKKRDPKTKTFKAYSTGYSPAVSIQVLTSLYRVWLRWMDKNQCFFCDVVVGEMQIQNLAIWVACLVL